MDSTSNSQHDQRSPPAGDHACAPASATRRSFLRQAGSKAKYAVPIVVALAASHAHAGSEFDSTCADAGSPCNNDGDCCGALTCQVPSMLCG